MDAHTSFSTHKLQDEATCVSYLLQEFERNEAAALRVQEHAISLIQNIRQHSEPTSILETFLQQYPLNSEEGRVLMTLAEAFLRIPDNATRNTLIRDRLRAADWSKGKGAADWFSRFAGLGLMASKGTLNSVLGKLGEPFIRKGVEGAMKRMGEQFVFGETIATALKQAAQNKQEDYSFDMLGEGARTYSDAERYFEAYRKAIQTIGETSLPNPAGISVKLSALHPRYELAHRDLCVPALREKLEQLCRLAAEKNIALTVDAEETDRLEMSIDIFDHVLRTIPRTWCKFGLAVQAYQKNAPHLIDHLALLATQAGRKIRVRLVKGAYWDTEIKRAQVRGLSDFPVYTRKCQTDLSYLVCAQKLLAKSEIFYPMFGTHNAYTVAAIFDLAKQANTEAYEFQRLHGMGDALYRQAQKDLGVSVTVYAPIGKHQDLLPYLVRRLLENGANTSFVHDLYNDQVAPAKLVIDPVEESKRTETKRHKGIHLPHNIFPGRKNSDGLDLQQAATLQTTLSDIKKFKPLIEKVVIHDTPLSKIEPAFLTAKNAMKEWRKTPVDVRAKILEQIATHYEKNRLELMAYLIYEGGKTLPDAESEVREAVDFCRYYAAQGRIVFEESGKELPGPTGEANRLHYEPRGLFVCISPWNFPLAIFMGQIAAALMAGNCVLAKPAEQTPKIAARILQIIEKSGLPKGVLQVLIGDGALGAELTHHEDIAGIAFTGSTEVAKKIQMTLASKEGPIVPLIAETGGQNAMIVDSTALPEQVVDDIIRSAFGSAGQRCSALRVLYLQNEIADRVIELLQGAVATLRLGVPDEASTDIGPVIDGDAHNKLTHHKKYLDANAIKLAEADLPNHLRAADDAFYFAPCAYEIKSMEMLDGEIFGPILHVVRYNIESLEYVLREINQSGFGLTFGVHSRIESRINMIAQTINAGNIYVNRSMIGAVVGSQPFGGRGLSGTGPKAGGPNYLKAFATEKLTCTDTTASGGNASLVSLIE